MTSAAIMHPESHSSPPGPPPPPPPPPPLPPAPHARTQNTSIFKKNENIGCQFYKKQSIYSKNPTHYCQHNVCIPRVSHTLDTMPVSFIFVEELNCNFRILKFRDFKGYFLEFVLPRPRILGVSLSMAP